jgi:hypothetical protein
MKIKLTLLLFLISSFVFPQEFTKFRMNNKQKLQFWATNNVGLLKIEEYLDKNEEYLNENSQVTDAKFLMLLNDPTLSINELTKLKIKNICSSCYLAEYENQKKRQSDIIQHIKKQEQQKDSIRNLEQIKIKKIREAEQLKKDSLDALKLKPQFNSIDSVKVKNGYDGLRFHLDLMSPQWVSGYATPFIGIDYSFAAVRFAAYIISKTDYTLDDKCSFEFPNKKIHCFTPKIQYRQEISRCKVIYTTMLDKSKFSCIEGKKAQLITNVSIQGNPDIILDIFVKYWQTKINIQSNKVGVVATCRFMGDYISLKRINHTTFRIDITKNPNIEMNYYTLFKIK